MQLHIYRLMEQTTGRGDFLDPLMKRTLDLSEFRTRLMHDNAGAKALSWLLKSAKYDQLEATFHIDFIQATGFCLVGEDKKDIWWDLLTISHAPKSFKDTTVSNEKYSTIRWTNAWITTILEARMFWTTDKNMIGASRATFNEVIRFNAGRTSETRIHVSGAFGWLMAKLPVL